MLHLNRPQASAEPPLYKPKPVVELSRSQEERLKEIIREEIRFALASFKSTEKPCE